MNLRSYRNHRSAFTIGLLLLLLLLPAWAYQVPYNPLEFTTGVFHDCPPEGEGGDPDHNILKNRDKPPASYEEKTIQEIIAYNPELLTAQRKKRRKKWMQPAVDLVTEWERKGAVVEGRLIVVKSPGRRKLQLRVHRRHRLPYCAGEGENECGEGVHSGGD